MPFIQAMKRKAKPNNTFPLSTIMKEITDHIAYFLTFDDIESKQEFLERTKPKKKQLVPDSCRKHLPAWRCCILSAFCPNKAAIALIQTSPCLRNDFFRTSLVIIDLKNDQTIHEEQLYENNYHALTLSRGTNSFATLHQQFIPHKNLHTKKSKYKQIITMKNTATKKTKPFKVPNHFASSHIPSTFSLDFNKQETDIIIHGVANKESSNNSTYNNSNIPIRHHIIIPLITDKTKIHLDKKTLDRYFAQRMVCKNFKNEPNLTKK